MSIKKYRFLILSLLLFNTAGYSQLSISGKITDSLSKPVFNASVSVKQKDGLIRIFSFSDRVGKYYFSDSTLAISDSLFISVNVPGFREMITKIDLTKQEINFSMGYFNQNSLPDVEVKNSKSIIRKKNDTLTYNAEFFSVPQDRLLIDIIKRLPGINVNDDGEISYEGRPINRLYIEGDNLVDGQYNLLTNNLPKDAVSSIQILEGHQPVKALKDIEISQQAALNIVLKNSARIKMIGQENLATGLPGNFQAELNAMILKTRIKFLNSLKLNNTGVELKKDLHLHFGPEISSPVPPPLLSLSGANPSLGTDRFFDNHSFLGTVNLLYKLSSIFDVRVNISQLSEGYKQQSDQYRSLFFSVDTIRYLESQLAHTREKIWQSRATLIANTNKFYFNNSFSIENAVNQANSNIDASGYNPIKAMLSGSISNFSNELHIIKGIYNRFLIEGYSYILSSDNPVNLTVQPGESQFNFNAGLPYSALFQKGNIPNLLIQHFIVARKSGKVAQSFKIGVDYQRQKLNSSLFIIDFIGETKPAPDSFVNQVSWKRTKTYMEAKLSSANEKFQWDAGINFNRQDIYISDLKAKQNILRYLVSPNVNGKINLWDEHNFTFRSSYFQELGNIRNIYSGLIMTSYRNFNSQEEIVPEYKYFSNSANLNFRKTLKLLFISIGISHIQQTNNFIVQSEVSQQYNKSKLVFFPNTINNLVYSASISKYLFPLRTTITGLFSTGQNGANQFLNGNLVVYRNHVNTYEIRINSKLAEFLNASYSGTIFSYKSSPASKESIFFQQSQKVRQYLEINIQPVINFYFKCNVEDFSSLIAGQNKNQVYFIDAAFVCNIDKLKMDIELAFKNLANISAYKMITVSSNQIDEQSFGIRPRMALVKFVFKI